MDSNSICTLHTHTKKKPCSCWSAETFHLICLPDTNQKVKIYMVGDVGAVNLLAHVFLCHTERINALWPWDTRGGSSANKTSLPAGHIRSEESGNDKSHSPTFIQTCSSSTQWNQTIVRNRRFFPSVHSDRTFRDAGWLASESVQTGLSISNAQMGLMAAGGVGKWVGRRWI